jgi:hypothetical protein
MATLSELVGRALRTITRWTFFRRDGGNVERLRETAQPDSVKAKPSGDLKAAEAFPYWLG